MKVSELKGPLLDYWVGKAAGFDVRIVIQNPTNLSKENYDETI
jgi:hypothetical protein